MMQKMLIGPFPAKAFREGFLVEWYGLESLKQAVVNPAIRCSKTSVIVGLADLLSQWVEQNIYRPQVPCKSLAV